ncbi:MAG: hypothetical protein HY893_03625 [Deltaproteobacteria bacterium]|nr:hypothetical protein [Deltaproteobacteria bacterium]
MSLSGYKWGWGDGDKAIAFYGWVEAISPGGSAQKLLAEWVKGKSVMRAGTGVISGSMPRRSIGRSLPLILKNVNENRLPSIGVRADGAAKEALGKAIAKAGREDERLKAGGKIRHDGMESSRAARATTVRTVGEGKLAR